MSEGLSFDERRARVQRMVRFSQAIARAQARLTEMRGDALRDALARVDEVEAHAARLRAAAQDLLDADADVPMGESVSVEAVNRYARKVLARKALAALIEGSEDR